MCSDAEIEFEAENPKRPGTRAHAKYRAYATATTVRSALQMGADLRDLDDDYATGYLKSKDCSNDFVWPA